MPVPSSTVVGVEGEPLQVAMRANANPMSIAYTWTKDGQPIDSAAERIVSEGPILNITRLERSDAGIYTCEAVNSQGAQTINITIIVECKYAHAMCRERSRVEFDRKLTSKQVLNPKLGIHMMMLRTTTDGGNQKSSHAYQSN